MRLRIASLLSLALLLYAATPHLHASAGSIAGRDAESATPRLLADDAHDEHSPLDLDGEHPCTLCREQSAHATALSAARPDPVLDAAAGHTTWSEDPVASGARFARRHPARAPPGA